MAMCLSVLPSAPPSPVSSISYRIQSSAPPSPVSSISYGIQSPMAVIPSVLPSHFNSFPNSVKMRSKKFVALSNKPPSINIPGFELVQACLDGFKQFMSSIIASLIPKLLSLINFVRSKLTVVDVITAIKATWTIAIPAILSYYAWYKTVIDICEVCPNKWKLIVNLFKEDVQKTCKEDVQRTCMVDVQKSCKDDEKKSCKEDEQQSLLNRVIKIMFTDTKETPKLDALSDTIKEVQYEVRAVSVKVNELINLANGGDLHKESQLKISGDVVSEDVDCVGEDVQKSCKVDEKKSCKEDEQQSLLNGVIKIIFTDTKETPKTDALLDTSKEVKCEVKALLVRLNELTDLVSVGDMNNKKTQLKISGDVVNENVDCVGEVEADDVVNEAVDCVGEVEADEQRDSN